MSAFETEASGLKLSMRVKATANVFIKDIKDKSSNYSDEQSFSFVLVKVHPLFSGT
jgi:hypothetical protein